MNKKKWFTLSVVGAALLLIPRRSSRQTLPVTQDNLKPTNKDKSQLPNRNAKEANSQ